jgi:hypothetical protein
MIKLNIKPDYLNAIISFAEKLKTNKHLTPQEQHFAEIINYVFSDIAENNEMLVCVGKKFAEDILTYIKIN